MLLLLAAHYKKIEQLNHSCIGRDWPFWEITTIPEWFRTLA